MAETLEPKTLVVLKDENGFEIYFEEESYESWYISHYSGQNELFSIDTKKNGKIVHGFVVFYSSLNVRNLYELYSRMLIYPEKTIRDLLGVKVKIGKIVIVRKNNDIEGFKCCPFAGIFGLDTEQENEKRVMINMWLSKTFIRRDCEKYLAQLNVPILEHARISLMRVKEVKVIPEWRHYCGLEPRYWYIEIKEDGSITFEGGMKWKAKVKGDTLYTDGCVTRGMLIDVVNEGLKHVMSLKCRNEQE